MWGQQINWTKHLKLLFDEINVKFLSENGFFLHSFLIIKYAITWILNYLSMFIQSVLRCLDYYVFLWIILCYSCQIIVVSFEKVIFFFSDLLSKNIVQKNITFEQILSIKWTGLCSYTSTLLVLKYIPLQALKKKYFSYVLARLIIMVHFPFKNMFSYNLQIL